MSPRVKTIRNNGYALVDAALPYVDESDGRSHGVHVSGIIGYMAGYRDRVVAETGSSTFTPTELMKLGKIVENGLIEVLQTLEPDRFIKPPELGQGPPYGTPDLYDIYDDCFDEIKYTAKSSRHGPGSKQFKEWEEQLMAYCHRGNVGKGRLRIVHCRGDYTRGSLQPDYRVWEKQYTRSELVANWANMMAHWKESERMT